MKINSNITKLQQGGLTPPFVSWDPVPSTPVAPASPAPTSNTSDSGSSDPLGGLLSKDMTKLLMENGLPSDVEALVGSISELYNDPIYQVTGDLNTSSMASRYLSILSSLNRIKYNKELYTDEVERLTKNGGISDVAITNLGRIVAQDLDNGLITQITPEEYQEGNYRAMTNGELAKLRATNPNMAFDNNIFQVLNNGIGSSDILKFINDSLTNLGSTSYTNEGYLSSDAQFVINGIKMLREDPEVGEIIKDIRGAGGNGIYKITSENQSNVKQASEALDYIYGMMPENMKNYLRSKAAINGLDPNEGALTLLTSYIQSKTNTTSKHQIDFDDTLTKAIKGEGAAGSSGKEELSPIDMLQRGMHDPNALEMIKFNPGTTFQYETIGTRLPYLNKLNSKETWGNAKLSEVLSNSTISAGNKENMYFGNKKINPQDVNRLMYLDDHGVSFAFMPVKGDGSPDLDLMERIQKAENKIKEEGITEPIAQREVYNEFQVSPYYNMLHGTVGDRDKMISSGMVKPFYMVHAAAVNDDGFWGVNKDYSNPYVTKVTDYGTFKNMANEALNKGLDGKPGEIDLDDPWVFKWMRDDIYEGVLYIEAADAITARSLVSGVNIPSNMASLGTMMTESNSLVQKGY